MTHPTFTPIQHPQSGIHPQHGPVILYGMHEDCDEGGLVAASTTDELFDSTAHCLSCHEHFHLDQPDDEQPDFIAWAIAHLTNPETH